MLSTALALEVLEVSGLQVLDDLGHPYDDLAERVGVPMTSRRPWLSAWTHAYPNVEPWAIGVWEDDDLVGACLLAREDVGPHVRIVALGHGRNDRTRFLAASEAIADAIAGCVARRLEQCPRGWCLRVEQLPVDDPVATALAERLPNARLLPGGSIPVVELRDRQKPADHLSKNLRRQLQKCRNRLVADSISAEMSFTRSREALRGVLEMIEDVHRTRDHDVGRASDLDDAAGRQLWRNIINAHIDRGETEIATLHLDGQLAAYVVSFIDHCTYRVFDGRFDTRWARYSPGRLLETEALARAMTHHGLRQLDWMNSVASDKLVAANALEPSVHLVASSDPLRHRRLVDAAAAGDATHSPSN